MKYLVAIGLTLVVLGLTVIAVQAKGMVRDARYYRCASMAPPKTPYCQKVFDDKMQRAAEDTASDARHWVPCETVGGERGYTCYKP